MEESKPSEEVQATSTPAVAAEEAQDVRETAIEEPSAPAAPSTSTSATVGATATTEKKDKEGSDSDDDDDDEDVIEESPCQRYIKRREVVKYRDVPGIGNAECCGVRFSIHSLISYSRHCLFSHGH